jgi:hypothetical protein
LVAWARRQTPTGCHRAWALAALVSLVAPALAVAQPPLSVACAKAGTITFSVKIEGADLAATVTYPKPIRTYLGGFDKNGTKNTSAAVRLFLDTDANPKTGLGGDPVFEPGQQGAEWSLEASEIETSLARDDKGGWINGPKLDATVRKGEDTADLPEGVFPEWEFEVGGAFVKADWVKPPDATTMRLRVPLAALALKAGDTVRVTVVVPLCNAAFPFPGKAEATFTMR